MLTCLDGAIIPASTMFQLINFIDETYGNFRGYIYQRRFLRSDHFTHQIVPQISTHTNRLKKLFITDLQLMKQKSISEKVQIS